MRCSLLAAVFALLFPLSVNAEEPGDPACGALFCDVHIVLDATLLQRDDKSPNSAAPTFVSVAKTSGMTRACTRRLARNITSDDAQFCRRRKRSRRRDCIYYEFAAASCTLTLSHL